MSLLLEHRRAAGDILMMTCAVRDLHRAFPGKYQTGVTTSAMSIWQGNPDISQVRQSPLLKLSYGAAVKQSNQRAGHFAGAFNEDLGTHLHMSIPLTDLRGCLFLSDKEKDPALRSIKEPYWVIAPGGKSDFSAKIWDKASWQATVTRLRPYTQLVQIGANPSAGWSSIGISTPRLENYSPELQGVTSLVGRTNPRELMSLIYHSEGVICLVSFPMHIAAALNKPCIVIAGGREPWWWEAYTRSTWEANCSTPVPPDFVEHRYLHTLGQLPCCNTTACWRSGVGEKGERNCKDIVQGVSQKQPKCMTLIQEGHVIQAFHDYQDGRPVASQPIPEYLGRPLHLAAPSIVPPVTRNRVEVQPVARGQMAVKYTHRTPEGLRVVTKPGATRVIRPPTRTRVDPQPAMKTTVQPARVTQKVAAGLVWAAKRPTAPHPIVGTYPLLKPPQGILGDSKGLDLPLTVCVLLYGDYLDLAMRCLGSVKANMPAKDILLRIGMNAVTPRVRDWVLQNMTGDNTQIYDSPENILKYPMMRRLFYAPAIDTEWTMWLDDDSHITAPDFLPKLDTYLQQNSADYIGKPYYVTLDPGQVRWIQEAPWYRGAPVGTKVDFATGGFWLIRSSVIRALNWPDTRIGHNFGDVSLGEAVRQNDYRFGRYHYGVAVNDAPRRGISQKYPAS